MYIHTTDMRGVGHHNEVRGHLDESSNFIKVVQFGALVAQHVVLKCCVCVYIYIIYVCTYIYMRGERGTSMRAATSVMLFNSAFLWHSTKCYSVVCVYIDIYLYLCRYIYMRKGGGTSMSAVSSVQ